MDMDTLLALTVGLMSTLMEESLCGRKFCGFGSNRKSLFPQNILKFVNRKSFFRKIFMIFPTAKVFSVKFYIIFRREIPPTESLYFRSSSTPISMKYFREDLLCRTKRNSFNYNFIFSTSKYKYKDIRTFFQQPRAAEKQNENDDQQNRQTTIVID